MGIEDLNLDLDEHADRIMVVSDSTSQADKITRLLEKRSYNWKLTTTTEEASQVAAKELFDIIIFDSAHMPRGPAEIVASLKEDPHLKRSPILLLHSRPGEFSHDDRKAYGDEVQVVEADFSPSQLLVKIATQLRLRKIRSDQASFDAKVAAQNAQLRDLTNRFKRELKEAQSIQQSILPKKLPYDKRCIFTAMYVPLEAVGGDLYDVWEVEPGVYGFFIGDVTGHGLSAAFIGAMSKMALSYAEKISPEELLFQMNEGIVELMPEGKFVTVAAAFYDAGSGALRVARGGHPPPYIWRSATGEVEQVSPRGMPIGFLEGARYELFETSLEPGDKFLMVTDGIPEASDMGGEMVGIDGLGEWFSEYGKTQNIIDCMSSIMERLDVFVGGRILKDDNTLVGLERVRT